MTIGLTAGAVVIACGLIGWLFLYPPMTADQAFDRARKEKQLGHFSEAEALAWRSLELDPQLKSAAILAADCASAQLAWQRALDYLGHVKSRDPNFEISVRLRKAEILHHHLYHLAKAEEAYRTAIELDPDNVNANNGLAQLLSLCGRKREAIPLVLRLIRRNVETDLLILLARSETVVNDLELLTQAHQADPTDPNPPVGLAWHALENDKYNDAENLLRSSLLHDSLNVPARILLGRLLLVANRTEEFSGWANALPPAASHAADAWLIRGQMADAIGDGAGAIRCYWEALRLAPESKTATFRLAHGLASAGDSVAADALRERMLKLYSLEEVQNRVLFSAGQARSELLGPLAEAYESAGRLWEAYAWSQLAINIGVDTDQSRHRVARLQPILRNEPLQLVPDVANMALSMDLARYPIPTLALKSEFSSTEAANTAETPTFRNDAKAVGLAFQYFNGVEGPPTHRMFEFTGGGIGVLDFDMDSFPDLFFTQGCSWPQGSPDISGGDRLFRNQDAVRFEDVTRQSGITEDGFGQGVAIGDFNSDGFPDIRVANIGQNRLWQNQGDGSFLDITVLAGMNSNDWTTSTLMADLTGDGLPDVYDATYAADKDVFDRKCHHADGSIIECLPSNFHDQVDHLWKNSGDGRFEDATFEVLGEVPAGMGLGVAAWDADGQGRLSLFVANDTTRCFFFRPDPPQKQTIHLRERGIEAGVALNGAGKATGAMGIAVGDINDDGQMDLLITNFYAEPNTLFLSTVPGYFEDQTRRWGLEEPSMNMLGFGTQFLDADLDGRLELFVSNGHVDDLSRFGRPYRMPAQLFRLNDKGQFSEISKNQLGSYFEQKWLGRAVARIDWNRDGRDDLAVGHLNDPVAILSNATKTVGNHLSLRLVGIRSNRDAIGSIVTAHIGSRTLTRQVTTGDGYQCSNERRLIFGLARESLVDELVIRWPSGLVQRFQDLAAPARLVIREGSAPLIE